MKKLFITLAALALIGFASCGGNEKNAGKAVAESNEQVSDTTTWEGRYVRINPDKLTDNVIDLISNQWMLVTAGVRDSFNTMTASWGAMGEIWSRPASFIFIRDTRYTYQFLQRETSYTLSFFDKQYRKALQICGTKSGRDGDKVAEAGLTPVETPLGMVSFEEARLIVECEKMFVQKVDTANLCGRFKAEVVRTAYTGETAPHYEFVGEIKNVWMRR